MRKLVSLFMAMTVLVMTSCQDETDLTPLEDRIDQLEADLAALESEQQAALDQQLIDLMEMIEALEGDNAALLTQLAELEGVVASNAEAIYFGNIITDEDYEMLKSNSDIKVVAGGLTVSSTEQLAAIAELEMIGGDIRIEIAGSYPLLSIGGDMIIESADVAEAVEFTNLASVGGDITVDMDASLTSFNADELKVIGGDFEFENINVTTISMAALDLVAGDFSISNNDWSLDPSLMGIGQALTTLSISETDVAGDVILNYLPAGSIQFGELGGSFTLNQSATTKFGFANQALPGDLKIQFNVGGDVELAAPNLTSVEGDFYFYGNVLTSYSFPPVVYGSITSITGTEGIEYIGGNVTIDGNGNMADIQMLNTVTKVGGSKIKIGKNGDMLGTVEVLNALVKMENRYGTVELSNIRALAIKSFNSLDSVYNLTIQGVTGQVQDYANINSVKINSFDKLRVVSSNLKIDAQYGYVGDITFPALSDETEADVKIGRLYFWAENDTQALCGMVPVMNRWKDADYGNSWAYFYHYYNTSQGIGTPTSNAALFDTFIAGQSCN